MRGLIIAALVLFPSEAYLSGSSTVHADSKYFRVELESVRKIFERDSGDAERDWHAEWRKSHQPVANRIKKKIEADIESMVEPYGLLPFRAELREVVEESETDEGIEALESKRPFRYRLRFEGTSVIVVLAKLPPKKARHALHKALARHIPSD